MPLCCVACLAPTPLCLLDVALSPPAACAVNCTFTDNNAFVFGDDIYVDDPGGCWAAPFSGGVGVEGSA